ncbi:bacteriophage T4 gp5 trimerisation domain-containing protein, partial [Pyxidicoccus fallax]|nr:type VI secretion system tip protein VgrG [Pyxidicoccus fallax]
RKSASSLGSNGFNEVRIEDATGEEEVFTHAQKDEDLLTENDKSQEVRAFEDLLVKKDRKRTVEGNQQLRVIMDDVSVVEGNQTLLVQKNRDTRTTGSHDEAVEGNQAMTVGKNITVGVTQGAVESVGAAKATTIGGAYLVNVALAMNEAVGGLKSSEIGAAYTEFVVGSRQEMVAKDKQAKVGTDFKSEIKGQLTETVGKDSKTDSGARSELTVKEDTAKLAKEFQLKADTFNLVVNEKLILSIEKSGNVKLFANKLSMEGTDIKFKGAKVKMEAAGSLKGKSVKTKDIDALTDAELKKSVAASFNFPNGNSLEGQSFEVKLADGSTKKGKMGGGMGSVAEAKPGAAEMSLPDLVKDLESAG